MSARVRGRERWGDRETKGKRGESELRSSNEKGLKRRKTAEQEQNSFSDRRAGVNDLAAHCTPVERVDSGYANLTRGSTEPRRRLSPSLFSLSPQLALFSSSQ